MKQQFTILFLLLFLNLGGYLHANSSSKDPNLVLPTATIIANNNDVFVGGAQPIITFIGADGTAPYTFTYTLNGGAELIIKTSSGNAVTVTQPTNVAGIFEYKLVSVTDSKNETQTASTSVTINVNAPPVATFTTPNNNNSDPTCSSTAIQFSANQTQSGSTYSYSWDFGDGSQVFTSKSASTTHVYEIYGIGTQSYDVDLTVTNTVTGCSTTINNQKVVVKKSPDASLVINSTNGAVLFDVSKNVFINCEATILIPNFVFKAVNATTTSSLISNYTINWGDGSPTENLGSTFSSITHEYTKLGFFSITVTVTGTGTSCTTAKTYRFFNGNSPKGNLVSEGDANGCVPYSYTWPVDPITFNNPPGTSYIFSVNDGSAAQTFTQENLPKTISHQFNKPSCGLGLESNKFIVTFQITNPCDSNKTTTTVLSTQKPIAKFSILPNSATSSFCVNNQIKFTNESVGFYGTSCNINYNKTWTITPSTGWTINSGSLTTDNLDVTFNVAGNYQIKLAILQPNGNISNICTNDEFTKTICIEPPLTPTFTLNTAAACIPQVITATNTTDSTKSCEPPKYSWAVTHKPEFCGTTVATIPPQTTTNGSFNFTEPGTYTIRLTATNSCSPPQSTFQTVTIKRPPKVSVATIADKCGGVSGATIIKPTATVDGCGFANSELVYNWSFPGGTPATSNAIAPEVTYSTGGAKTISLFVSVVGGCGNSATVEETFGIGTAPTLSTLSPENQAICSGSSTVAVPLVAETGSTFSWTATTVPLGVTLNTNSGTGSTIPALTISNATTAAKTVVLTITSTLNGCPSTNTYEIVVNPGPTLAQPSGSTLCVGGTMSPLSVSLSPPPAAGTVTYKWYSNTDGNNTVASSILVNTSTTDGTYMPTATLGSVYYFCEISFTSAGSCPTIKSKTVEVALKDGIKITTQPQVAQRLCIGGTLGSPISADASGGIGTLIVTIHALILGFY